ncbi:hypothetical protein R1sor_022633 [Riccia sorocarpa]|uniref:Killer toxin Kp4 domain-containing protein n=1 Tax=Riccia sorocarpa TaxID=122646 RepID=A0ABD3GMF3_9MARC
MAAVSCFSIVVSGQDSFSCSGSSLCRDLAQSDCDAAFRQIQAGNRYFTGGNKGSTGVCSGHCGLFVSGSNCDLTGQEMIDAFHQLRDRNCAKCGVKTYNDGCKFKADYEIYTLQIVVLWQLVIITFSLLLDGA